MEKKPLISIENLRKTYIMGDNEVKALQSASLNIYKNEYVALMGPSGSFRLSRFTDIWRLFS
jgi:putative ABC transport system ATP-binding protein